MKRLGAGLVVGGVLVVVFCLVTACVVGRDHDSGAVAEPPIPDSPSADRPDCTACCLSDGCTPTPGLPTLAPPRPKESESAAGLRIESRPRGQVVYIDVELQALDGKPAAP